MNRSHHLKLTLLNNIALSAEYPELEIILLDYNSKDDLEEWAREKLCDYIGKGTVTYYKTFDPVLFSHSHSKNLAFKLATGTIVCNINADNFIGNGFAAYISDVFRKNSNIFLRPELGTGFASGTAGVVCVNKADFLKVGGFDERMVVYGWEDVDFNNRLLLLGLDNIYFRNKSFLDALDHGIEEKYNLAKLLSDIHEIYISSTNPLEQPESKLLILYKDRTFKFGTVINNLVKASKDVLHAQKLAARRIFEYELKEYFWIEGIWQETNARVELIGKTDAFRLDLSKSIYRGNTTLSNSGNDILLYHIVNMDLLARIACFEIDYTNRLVMLDNETKRNITANNNKFGQARVFKNFDYETAIEVK